MTTDPPRPPAQVPRGATFRGSFSVRRPAPGVLVVAEPRGGAILRVAMWCVLVAIFAFAPALAGDPRLADGGWLAAVIALALSPYLLDGLRGLRRRRAVTIDSAAGTVTADGRVLALDAVRHVEIGAVNATCEEAAVSLQLADGGAVALATGGHVEDLLALAREAAALAGVPLRGTGGVEIPGLDPKSRG